MSVTASSISSAASSSSIRSGVSATSATGLIRASAGAESRLPPRRCRCCARLALALLQVGDALLRRRLDVAQHRQADDLVLVQQPDAAHAGAVAPGEHAHLVVGQLEADAAARCGSPAARRRPRGRWRRRSGWSPSSSFIAIRPDGADVAEIRQPVAPHIARRGGEDQVQAVPQRLVLRQRQHGGDRVRAQFRQQVDQRPALRRSARLPAAARPSRGTPCRPRRRTAPIDGYAR